MHTELPKGCIFTGHRIIPSRHIVPLREQLLSQIEALVALGHTDFFAGGAMGFDRMAADAVLHVKKRHPHIKLHLLLPCHNQEKLWNFLEKRAYQKQLRLADTVHYLADAYYDGCMKVRNQALADHALFCICYVAAGGASGARQTKRMVEEKGVRCLNLYDIII